MWDENWKTTRSVGAVGNIVNFLDGLNVADFLLPGEIKTPVKIARVRRYWNFFGKRVMWNFFTVQRLNLVVTRNMIRKRLQAFEPTTDVLSLRQILCSGPGSRRLVERAVGIHSHMYKGWFKAGMCVFSPEIISVVSDVQNASLRGKYFVSGRSVAGHLLSAKCSRKQRHIDSHMENVSLFVDWIMAFGDQVVVSDSSFRSLCESNTTLGHMECITYAASPQERDVMMLKQRNIVLFGMEDVQTFLKSCSSVFGMSAQLTGFRDLVLFAMQPTGLMRVTRMDEYDKTCTMDLVLDFQDFDLEEFEFDRAVWDDVFAEGVM